MNWLGLDIGGANIKAADGRGYARSYSFALWRDPSRLPQEVRAVIADAPACDGLAVTMTGELADCFESKAAGVRFILEAVMAAADSRSTLIYLVDGRLVPPQEAFTAPHLAAASNWHALARFAGRHAQNGAALLIDVGSTTCDVIPLLGGTPVAKGATDTQRLIAGELVYTGVERSPVCGVVDAVPFRGQMCPIVQELFATMRDVYLVVGQLPEEPADSNTADGRPAMRAHACLRLARMVAADRHEFDEDDAMTLARTVADAQAVKLADAIEKVRQIFTMPLERIILSGHGEFLARSALERLSVTAATTSLTSELGPVVSRCAPAHALAVLAREHTLGEREG